MAHTLAMNRPKRILRTLDGKLDHPVRLILYGCAALALALPDAPADFAATMDVDAILPQSELPQIEADHAFWEAISLTNQELETDGLYLTRLFLNSQVILTPDWLEHIVPISTENLTHLSLFRPSTADFLLTKMMRIDPQDRADLLILLKIKPLTLDQAKDLFSRAQVPDIAEIHDAFQQNI